MTLTLPVSDLATQDAPRDGAIAVDASGRLVSGLDRVQALQELEVVRIEVPVVEDVD